jgi:hypothetical protein
VERLQRHFGHREAERLACGISQRDGPQAVVTSHLDREPPFAVRETFRRREAAQPVPMQILGPAGRRPSQDGEFRKSFRRYLPHQVGEWRRNFRDFHRRAQKLAIY